MKDRVSSKPGRIALKREGTLTEEYYYMRLADEPSEAGTPMNKQNILTDDTEDHLFGNHTGRNINQTFDFIANNMLRSPNGKAYKVIFDTNHPYVTEDDGMQNSDGPSKAMICEAGNYLVYRYDAGKQVVFRKSDGAKIRTITASPFYEWDDEPIGSSSSPVIFYDWQYANSSSSHRGMLYNVANGASKRIDSSAKILATNSTYTLVMNAVYSSTKVYLTLYRNSDLSVVEEVSYSNDSPSSVYPSGEFVAFLDANTIYLGRAYTNTGNNRCFSNKVFVCHLNLASNRFETVDFSGTGWKLDTTISQWYWYDDSTKIVYGLGYENYDLIGVNLSTKQVSVISSGLFSGNVLLNGSYVCHVNANKILFSKEMKLYALTISGSTYTLTIIRSVTWGSNSWGYGSKNMADVIKKITIPSDMKIIPCHGCGFVANDNSLSIVHLYRQYFADNDLINYDAMIYLEELGCGELLSDGCSLQKHYSSYGAGATYWPFLTEQSVYYRLIGFKQI